MNRASSGCRVDIQPLSESVFVAALPQPNLFFFSWTIRITWKTYSFPSLTAIYISWSLTAHFFKGLSTIGSHWSTLSLIQLPVKLMEKCPLISIGVDAGHMFKKSFYNSNIHLRLNPHSHFLTSFLPSSHMFKSEKLPSIATGSFYQTNVVCVAFFRSCFSCQWLRGHIVWGCQFKQQEDKQLWSAWQERFAWMAAAA